MKIAIAVDKYGKWVCLETDPTVSEKVTKHPLYGYLLRLYKPGIFIAEFKPRKGTIRMLGEKEVRKVWVGK